MPWRFPQGPLRIALEWLGRPGIAFLILLAVFTAVDLFQRAEGLKVAIAAGLIVTGGWFAIRLTRRIARHAIWRLRNRLLVTYLFIAVVPIVLIVLLAVTGGEFLARQIAVYLLASELERRIDGLESAAQSVIRTAPADRPALIRGIIDLFYEERYPGVEVLLRSPARSVRYPLDATLPAPQDGWKNNRGALIRDGRFYLWSHTATSDGDITIASPLTGKFLAALVPGLGLVDFRSARAGHKGFSSGTSGHLREPLNRFDTDFEWVAIMPVADWANPGGRTDGYLVVRTRVSSVIDAVFNRKTDLFQEEIVIFLVAGAVLFLIVEIICVIIGVTMTRTITGAVHQLHEGTQRVMEGDFSHRIPVKGSDQLAGLSRSFNSMTENLERLVAVAKEKERLQSEIEIAREVQNQLYPRTAPASRSLRISAMCQPARICSGDYYDYECIGDTHVVLAIGDVAGKGISAALLMATLQSSLRTQLQNWLEMAAAAGDGRVTPAVSTSHLVSRLNNQLYAYTSPEKYATFCLGVFDERAGVFDYTNAGHLPPLLVRDGIAQPLDVNGTVVGAFPFSAFGESRVEMKSGDLLVCFTDGITEPENEYGEMFGEERLMDVLARNAHRSEEQIIELVIASVRQWTASDELQDDMTMLIARRA